MKSVFLLRFCRTIGFYIKWRAKKKNTKSHVELVYKNYYVHETMNFGSKKLTKSTKNL